MANDNKALIAKYERLRRLERELIGQINAVDAQLIEIESQLPDEYTYPGDPPLGDRPQGGKTTRY